MIKIIYIYFFGHSSSRIWLLRKAAVWSKLRGYNRMSRFFTSNIEKQYGCYLSVSANIHETVEFRHPVGIVIGKNAVIGKNSIIYQGVTLGGQVQGDWGKGKFPSIGDEVIIYAGAKVLGDIKIGDGAIVGANAVVVQNVPKRAVVAGVPARVIKYRDE